MADKFSNKTYKYSKGVYEANVYRLSDRELLYHDSKITDANFESSVNITEVVAGVGNATQIMLFDSAKFNLTLSAQDIDLRQYELQTGGTRGYNGIVMTCELVVATSSTLSVSSTPSAPYGSTKIVGYVNGDGTPYEIDPTTKEVEGFTAISGQTYNVRYYVSKAANEALNVHALFSPDIVSLEIKMPVYAAAERASANSGTMIGNLWVICPRYQFNGSASLAASQTSNVTPSLSGQAIAYDDVDSSSCSASSLSSLLYMVFEPIDAAANIDGFAVIGGGLTVAEGKTAVLPIKYLMADGSLAQVDYSELSYQSSAQGTATVSGGVVTGVSAGDCDITATNSTLAMSVVVPVTVTE